MRPSVTPPRFLAAGALLACPSLALALAQSPFATSVVQFTQGAGGGLFDPAAILGGPLGGGLGAGSLDVLTLGEAGAVTLGFDVTIVDGPGADFSVFENGFVVGGSSVFAELLYVEVSTDGVHFARFESSYTGSGSAMGSFRGLSGGMPVVANVSTAPDSPFDPSASGGEAFDLADLAAHPAVTGGLVDPGAIHFVRLVDCAPGSTDSNGVALPAGGGADVDAVAVLNSHRAPADGPTCDLHLDDAGRLNLVLGDPDGLSDLDLATLSATLDLAPIPPAVLAQVFVLVGATPETVHLRTPPLAGTGIVAAFGMSVRDLAGRRSGDQALVQG